MADLPPKERFTASNLKIHTWGIGYITDYWMVQQIMLMFLAFTTDFKMPPWLVAWVLAGPRLLDIVLDPLIGHWSDITHTRWGRRRPFMLVSSLLGAVAVILLWQMSPDWPLWAKACYLGATSTMLYLCYSTYEMTYYSLGFELSEDYNGRSKVFAIKGVYAAFAGLMGGYCYAVAIGLGEGKEWTFGIPPQTIGSWHFDGIPLFTGQFLNLGGTVYGLRSISFALAAMIIIFGLIPVLFCRERYAKANRQHVNIWQALQETARCRPFLLLMTLQVVRALGTGLYGMFGTYIGIFYVCAGDKFTWQSTMAGFGAFIGLGFSLLIWPAAKPLTKKIGKRWGLILGYGSALGSACVMPFAMQPGQVDIVFWVAVIFMPLTAIMGLFSSSIMPDICDIDELAHGERREGLFQAVQSFVNKAEGWGISLCSGMLLSWAGFDSDLPTQALDTCINMLWLGFVPLILFNAAAFVISWFMPFTPEIMADVHARLDVRRAAAAAQNPVTEPPATK